LSKLLSIGFIAGVGLSLAANHASANIISEFTTVFNTDWTTAGVGGMRGSGTGTLPVTGVGGPVTQSYLYWAGPTNSTNPNDNANVTVNGTGVTGTNIGFSQDNFWGFANSQAYRADTTSIINGNGSYALTNFVKPDAQVNGAGALLFFNDGNSSNNRDVVIFNGNDANFASSFDPAGWDMNLNGINYAGGQAFISFMVSDGQNFGPSDDGTISINGSPLISGGIFQGNSLCCGTGPTGNGNLWDIKTFDITAFLTLGNNNLHITLGPGFNDAIADIVTAIDLPAGAAPVGVPEPSSLPLVGIAISLFLLLGSKRAFGHRSE
jgi:hypothetical protein